MLPVERGPAVLVVEDDAETRAWLADIVAGDASLRLAGVAGTLAEGRAQCDAAAPDVVLVDLGLPDGSGLDLIRHVRARRPDAEVMVITVFGDEQHLLAAIEAGATGYLLKDAEAADIVQGIHDLLAGGSPISPGLARYVLRRVGADLRAERPRPEARAAPLTEREIEVVSMMARGFSYADIGRHLAISVNTVRFHVKQTYRKLEVGSRAEAILEASDLGLLGRRPPGSRQP
jgi:DNA-binding NarL/FixJ family response regulator